MKKYMALTGEISEHIECKNIDCFTPVYLASEVDAEREKDKARIEKLEGVVKKLRNRVAEYSCCCQNLGDGELIECKRCALLAATVL